jgi:hypothetical protein
LDSGSLALLLPLRKSPVHIRRHAPSLTSALLYLVARGKQSINRPGNTVAQALFFPVPVMMSVFVALANAANKVSQSFTGFPSLY